MELGKDLSLRPKPGKREKLMPKNGYYVIRTYKAGRIGEKIKYWVSGERPTKSARKVRSDIRKIQQNEASAIKRLARDLNANFSEDDGFITLTYSDEGLHTMIEKGGVVPEAEAVYLAAAKDLKNYIRRVKRELKKDGIELRWAAVTSDWDPEANESVRVHHHLVVNAEAREAVLKKWTAGIADFEALSGQADLTPVAAYMINQVRYLPDAKAYSTSRNLIRPQPEDRIALSGAELRVPKNASLLYRAEYIRPGAAQYIRYILPEYPSKAKTPETEEREVLRRRGGG